MKALENVTLIDGRAHASVPIFEGTRVLDAVTGEEYIVTAVTAKQYHRGADGWGKVSFTRYKARKVEEEGS